VRLATDDEGNLWAAFVHAPLLIKFAPDGRELATVRFTSDADAALAADVLKDPSVVKVASSDFDGLQLADLCRDVVFDAVHRDIVVLHGDARVTVLDLKGAIIRSVRPQIHGGTIQTIAVQQDGSVVGGYFLSSKLFSFEIGPS
jgi:hypothetical protein